MLDENGERIKLRSGDYKSYKVRTTDWDDPGNCERWRAAWADTTNRYLERAGEDVRIDLRSYERQGVDLVPTVHMGPLSPIWSSKASAQKSVSTTRKSSNSTVCCNR
ncbi:MAG: MobA/MobL family protein [Clostridia bacterium]|nr:MobA/MobL family protein [Clostridia bacterium]